MALRYPTSKLYQLLFRLSISTCTIAGPRSDQYNIKIYDEGLDCQWADRLLPPYFSMSKYQSLPAETRHMVCNFISARPELVVLGQTLRIVQSLSGPMPLRTIISIRPSETMYISRTQFNDHSYMSRISQEARDETYKWLHISSLLGGPYIQRDNYGVFGIITASEISGQSYYKQLDWTREWKGIQEVRSLLLDEFISHHQILLGLLLRDLYPEDPRGPSQK